MKTVVIDGKALEYVRLPSAHPREGAPSMVFLHEGLGSISLWRDFPQRLADATGCEAVVFSREGYGRSDPESTPRRVDYMHRQGLEVLPAFLDALGLERPILFGHSDGGSIALICAGGTPTLLTAIVVMAPHVRVEEITLGGILAAGLSYAQTDLPQRLGRHHRDADRVFQSWYQIWTDPAFRAWNIESYLPTIRCPILAIQGEDDEYGTLDQIDRIAQGAADVDLVKLADCRHSPHKDQADAVIEVTQVFVERVLEGD